MCALLFDVFLNGSFIIFKVKSIAFKKTRLIEIHTSCTVMLVDEEAEDIEEEELDCEGEHDADDSPPWDDYCDDDLDDGDIDDTTEDTALLRASAAKTEIVITPMSPVGARSRLF